MAVQPIVLGSNITGGDYGALPTDMNYYIPTAEAPREQGVENADGSITMPTYGIEATDSTGIDWSMYGTEYLPMFNYFTRVKTGEYNYNPDDDKIDPEDPLPNIPDLSDKFTEQFGMTPEEAIKQEVISYGQQITAGLGAQAGRNFAADGNFTQGFEAMDVFRPPEKGTRAKVPYSPGTENYNLESLSDQPIVQQELKDYYSGDETAFDARIAKQKAEVVKQNNIFEGEGNSPRDRSVRAEAKQDSLAATERAAALTDLKKASGVGASGGVARYLSGVGE